MSIATIACALALVVPLVVGLVLLIYVQNVHSTLARQLSQSSSHMLATSMTSSEAIRDRLTRCENGLRETSGPHLASELAALAGDVEALARTVKKNFGRVYAELHADGVLRRNAEAQDDIETPEQVRERLRREHGLPKLGNFNGAGSEQ